MSRFLRAATLITAARAVAFDGVPAQATETVVPDATFYRPEITEGPSIQELLKRDEDTTVLFAPDNTCGYVSGLAGESISGMLPPIRANDTYQVPRILAIRDTHAVS
jgi:hypothetical protein